MSLSDLGEFGLIERIIARLGDAASRDILVPPGDDAAAWANEGSASVATVDSLAEGTHWRRDTMSLTDVGWRSVATSLSDLAAMGAEPGPLLIAAQLGPEVSLEDLDAFVDGVAAACRCFGARIAGGNIARAASTSFSATAIGSARDGGALLRRDAARAVRHAVGWHHVAQLGVGLDRAGLGQRHLGLGRLHDVDDRLDNEDADVAGAGVQRDAHVLPGRHAVLLIGRHEGGLDGGKHYLPGEIAFGGKLS